MPGWLVDTKWAELLVLSLRLLSTQPPSNGKKYPFDIDQQYGKDMKSAQKLILSVSELVWRFPTWAGGASCRPFRSISSLALSFFLQSHLCFDLIKQQELYQGKNTFKRIFHFISIVLLVTNNSLPFNQLCPLLYCGWWTAAADDWEMKAVAHFCWRRLCCPADENFHLPVCVSNQN